MIDRKLWPPQLCTGRRVSIDTTSHYLPTRTTSNKGSITEVMSNKPTWIKRFCQLDGNEFLCEIDREYITDKFNLTGLDEQVPFYKQSLEIILDIITEETLDTLLADSDDDSSGNQIDCEYNEKIVSRSSWLI